MCGPVSSAWSVSGKEAHREEGVADHHRRGVVARDRYPHSSDCGRRGGTWGHPRLGSTSFPSTSMGSCTRRDKSIRTMTSIPRHGEGPQHAYGSEGWELLRDVHGAMWIFKRPAAREVSLTSRCGGPRPRDASSPSRSSTGRWPGPLSLVVRRRAAPMSSSESARSLPDCHGDDWRPWASAKCVGLLAWASLRSSWPGGSTSGAAIAGGTAPSCAHPARPPPPNLALQRTRPAVAASGNVGLVLGGWGR